MKTLFTLATVCLVLALASPAMAGIITPADIPPGSSLVNLGWATVTSGPRAMDQKTLAGYTGIGVEGGFVPGEIDLDGPEFIRISFAQPTVVSEIKLGFQFTAGNYGDVVSEVARIKISDSPWTAGDLSVIDATHATWSGPFGGTVTNISQGVEPFAGVWQITNPFGNKAVNFLEFTAVGANLGTAPQDNRNSDFALVSATTVPEPSTLVMLGVGMAALVGSRRLRRNR